MSEDKQFLRKTKKVKVITSSNRNEKTEVTTKPTLYRKVKQENKKTSKISTGKYDTYIFRG